MRYEYFFSVYNTSGVILKEEELYNDILDISGLEVGIYQLIIAKDIRIQSGRFVKLV